MAREEEAALENACARAVEEVTADFRMPAAIARFWRQNLFSSCQLSKVNLSTLHEINFKSQLTIPAKLVEKVAKNHPT